MVFIDRKLWASATNPPSNAAPLGNSKFIPGCDGAFFSHFQLFSFQACCCQSGHGTPLQNAPTWASWTAGTSGGLVTCAARGASAHEDAHTGTGQSYHTAKHIHHFLFPEGNRLSTTYFKVTSILPQLILLIRGEYWGILLWLITLSIPLGFFFSLHF